jgi:hypothetical protein
MDSFMADELQPQRFIPFRKSDVVEMCLAEGRLPDSVGSAFRDFCRILEAFFHFEFHRVLERLKDCYAPFDPDTDTRQIIILPDSDRERLLIELVREMTVLLNAANFEQITEESLKQSMAVESLFKIRLAVDFSDFEDILFFRRGEQIKEEVLVSFFGLKKRTIRFVNYDRVLVYIRFKEQNYFDAQKRRHLFFKPGSTIIKLFRNVPQADLEMLFPNSEIRMKPIDKLIIGVPAAISGIIVMVSKLGASLILIVSLVAFWVGLREHPVDINQHHLVALGLGLGALAGYLFKQIGKFKNRKIRFMKTLTESLYFRNLDNNAGVFHHMIDAAEEEEFKEAVLAYYFLLVAGAGLSRQELDHAVERWLAERWNCRINFEVDDALKKLERLGIISIRADKIRCRPLEDAKRHLDKSWDNFFSYVFSQEIGRSN